MISFSSHKLHGPKGVGGLYINTNARKKLHPIIFGGGQQRNLRSGTLNVPGIVGMAEAMNLLHKNQKRINRELIRLRNILIQRLSDKNVVCINGSMEDRIPNNINMYFPGISAVALMEKLPEVIFSTGSACKSHSIKESYVLQCIGLNEEQKKSSIRLGLSKYTTEEEIISVADKITWALEMMH